MMESEDQSSRPGKSSQSSRMKFIVIMVALILISTSVLAVVILSSFGLRPHEPIWINGNGEFSSAKGVVSGTGTESNPYIIENYEINATGHLVGINIGNTTAYFIIRNCYVHGAGQLEIILDNVTNGRLLQDRCTATQIGYGIYLRQSTHCIIESVNSWKNSHHGLYLYYSDDNIIRDSSFSDSVNGEGILLSHSNGNSLLRNSCLRNNDNGIWLYDQSNDNTLSNNICNSNVAFGIHVEASCDNNSLSGNMCNMNGHDGIRIDSSNSGTMSTTFREETP